MKFFDNLKAAFNRFSDKAYDALMNPGETDAELLRREISLWKKPNIRRVLQWSDQGVKDPSGETPLILAAKFGRMELIAALLDHGVDINQRAQYKDASGALKPGYTAFFYAVINEQPAAAKLLLQRGILADFTEGNGEEAWSAKVGACRDILARKEFAEVAAILKARGNNPTAPKQPEPPAP